MKKCSQCGEEKDLCEFHKGTCQYGRTSQCKLCRNKNRRDRYNTVTRDKELKQTSEWSKNNKEKKVQYAIKYRKKRREEDFIYKMIDNCRIRICGVYKTASKTKTKPTMRLLGCSGEELAQHLEKQFQPGMTHDNYGEWHIDHIRPIASFDLSDPKEIEKCFHYTNLQPLWAEDNLKKKDKWT